MKFALALVLFACVGLSVQAAHLRQNKGELLCELCTTVANYIKELIQENLPEEKVKEDVQQLCNGLPTDLKEICTNDILPLVDNIYKDLASLTAEDVCKALEFCTA
ncbi:prosaposin-like [Diorhabda carinulata]|uniref:prosaposin-like n=1 Tax=Diorhabda carinulata TaxID=1163345 RepID=UPI0025A1A4E1|nr:prosaposin-like [Diorhabda carinulata]